MKNQKDLHLPISGPNAEYMEAVKNVKFENNKYDWRLAEKIASIIA